ncbi:hypothetical protein LguiB_005717 [Lonicera macranthoides]
MRMEDIQRLLNLTAYLVRLIKISKLVNKTPAIKGLCLHFLSHGAPEVLDITRKFMNKPVRILMKPHELTLEGINILACGIDVPQEYLVINFDFPTKFENYLHRKFYSVVVEELPTNVVDLLLTGFGLDCFLEKGAARLASNMVLPGRHDKNRRVLSNPPRASKALHNVRIVCQPFVVSSPLRLQNKECQSRYILRPTYLRYILRPAHLRYILRPAYLRLSNQGFMGLVGEGPRYPWLIYSSPMPFWFFPLVSNDAFISKLIVSIDFVDKYMIGQTLLSIGSVLSNAFSAHMLKDVSLKR